MNDVARRIVERLQQDPLLSLDVREWADIADQFEVTERHSTLMSGDILIIQLQSCYAAVEEPVPDKRVIRHLADIDEVRRFVAGRLEEYERMWDGCGCKIDYYS